MSRHGTISWTELNTWNPDAARAYYRAVMGWTFDEVPTAGTDNARPYFIAKRDGEPVAGIFTMVKPDFDGIPEHWFTYIAVDDLADAIAKSSAAGGRVKRDPFDIPGTGAIAIVADVNGAVMGFMQPIETA